jgi:AbrB family looped-hinge helix DNA binding protein
MSATVKPLSTKPAIATVTSKGQITIPVEIRRLLGTKTGDKLAFEPTPDGIRIVRKIDKSPFEKYAGSGNWLPPGYEGRDGIIRYFRESRGHDEIDDLIFGTE